MNRFSIWLCRLAGLSLLSLTLAVPAHAVPLANGLDGFRTTPGSSFTLPAALPSGFFGQHNGVDSDPVAAGTVILVEGNMLLPFPTAKKFLVGPGCHTGSTNHHCYEMPVVELFDTVVRRTTDAELTPGGAPVAIGVMLEYLSLKSSTPLEVHYGAEPSSFFDIFVELDGPQTPGSISIHDFLPDNTGLMDTVLPVTYSVTFAEQGGGFQTTVNGLQDVMQSTNNRISVVSEPGTLALCVGAVLALRRRLRSVATPA